MGRVQSFSPARPRRGVATRLTYGAAFVLLCSIWGSTWLVIRIGLEGAPPLLAASLRFVVASLILLVATCAAAASVAVKRWGHDMDPVSLNAFSMGTGAITLAAASLVVGETWAVPPWPTGVLAIVYLSIAGSVIAFVVYLWLLKRIE